MPNSWSAGYFPSSKWNKPDHVFNRMLNRELKIKYNYAIKDSFLGAITITVWFQGHKFVVDLLIVFLQGQRWSFYLFIFIMPVTTKSQALFFFFMYFILAIKDHKCWSVVIIIISFGVCFLQLNLYNLIAAANNMGFLHLLAERRPIDSYFWHDTSGFILFLLLFHLLFYNEIFPPNVHHNFADSFCVLMWK